MEERTDAAADSDTFFQMTAFDETGVVGHLIMRFTDEEKQMSFPIISTGIFPDFMYSQNDNMKTNSNL